MVYLVPLVLFFAANPSTLTLSLSLSSFPQSSWAFSLGVYSSTPLFQQSRIRHITPITCSSEGSNRLGFTRIDSTSSSITAATTTTTEATRSTTSRTTPTTTVPPPPPLIMMTQQTTTSSTSTTTSSSCSSDTPTSSRYQQQKQKQQQTKTTIIYGIRHARSMSNEWMSQEGNRWGDATFRDDLSFVDSPLSPMGYDQTQALQERLLNNIKKKKQQQRRRRHHSNHKNSHHDHHGGDNNNNNNNNNNQVMMVKNGEDDGSSNIHPHDDNDENTAQPSATDTLTTDNGHDHDDDDHDDDCFCFLSEIELVLISPLTRCLQTFEYGCRQALEMACHDNVDDVVVDHSCLQSTPPIMAFPLATERVYTSAETGRPLSQLQTEFPNIDWSLFFENNNNNKEDDEDNNNNNGHPGTLDTNAWWYTGRPCRHEINQDDDDDNDDNVDDNDNNLDFVEWRPYKQGQFYAVPGEPYIVFANRMEKLKNWIRQRPESKILLITHWGVLNHLSLEQQEDPCNTGICQLEI